jgi:hypothetical protein
MSLTLVPPLQQARPRLTAEVLAGLADLDALHETAADVYDITARELDDARKALQEAASALTEAEEAWNRAGTEMDAAARKVAAARKTAGVVLTATGYRAVTR